MGENHPRRESGFWPGLCFLARKLERKQEKVEGGGGGEKRFVRSPSPPPSFFFFFRACPSFLDEPREETFATQASVSSNYDC